MRRFTRLVSILTVSVLMCGCLVGCAGFRLDIRPNKSTLESIPGGKNKIVVDHPDGSGILVEVDLIGSVADTGRALLAMFGNPFDWFTGTPKPTSSTP